MAKSKQPKPDKHQKIKVKGTFNDLLKLAVKPQDKPKQGN